MNGIFGYIIAIVVTWVFKTLVDLGVRYSKTTENTVDDLLFNNAKIVIDKFLSLIKIKK